MTVSSRSGLLVAVDGISHAAITAAAEATLTKTPPRKRGGISWWDASGLFQELAMADATAGRASGRTLLLLYAADLAFRLRWEIRPLVAEGRTVVAAPYVETATAFGRAVGIPDDWIRDLFQFAPLPDASSHVRAAPRRRSARRGFVEFGCEYLQKPGARKAHEQIVERVRAYWTADARVKSPRSRASR